MIYRPYHPSDKPLLVVMCGQVARDGGSLLVSVTNQATLEPDGALTGTTPLHAAEQGGYKDLVQLLLANKSDVNAKDNEGRTPSHYAATTSHSDVAELLREHGGHE